MERFLPAWLLYFFLHWSPKYPRKHCSMGIGKWHWGDFLAAQVGKVRTSHWPWEHYMYKIKALIPTKPRYCDGNVQTEQFITHRSTVFLSQQHTMVLLRQAFIGIKIQPLVQRSEFPRSCLHTEQKEGGCNLLRHSSGEPGLCLCGWEGISLKYYRNFRSNHNTELATLILEQALVPVTNIKQAEIQ